MFKDHLVALWADRSTKDACETLGQNWVRVYEQSDKVLQLQLLHHLEFHVTRHYIKKVAAAKSAEGGARPKSAPARAPEQPATAARLTMADKVARIKEELGLDGALSVKDAIKEANEQMGLEGEGSLPQQASALLAALEI